MYPMAATLDPFFSTTRERMLNVSSRNVCQEGYLAANAALRKAPLFRWRAGGQGSDAASLYIAEQPGPRGAIHPLSPLCTPHCHLMCVGRLHHSTLKSSSRASPSSRRMCAPSPMTA